MTYIILLSKIEMKKIVDNQYENYEDDYINLNDFIVPNHYVGRKNNNETLR